MFSFLQDFYDDFLYNYSPTLQRITPKAIYDKVTRGFSDADLYNLDSNLAKLIHARIKAYEKINTSLCKTDLCTMPDSYEHITLWKRDLRKMVFAFDKLSDTSQNWLDADKYFNQIKDSDNSMDSTKWVKIVETRRNYIKQCLQLFGNNFSELWI